MSDIRYVTSRDGTRLAVAIHGSGPATVLSTLHVNDRIDKPGVGSRHWIRLVAPPQRIARYDARGTGLSARDVGALSVERCVEDLHAVVDSLGPEPVNLIGLSHGVPIAVHYATTQPERVGRLALCGGYTRGRLQREQTEAQVRETQTIAEAVRVAFSGDLPYTPSFRRALSLQFWPSASVQQLDELDPDIYVGRIGADTAAAYSDLTYQFNLFTIAPRVCCPTLIFHARRDRLVPFDEGSRLAALIPGARFVPLDSDNHLPLDGDPTWLQVTQELRAFLGLDAADAIPSSTRARERSAAVPSLTPRQIEVLRLISEGRTDKEIARILGLSPRTVEMHAGHALHALSCRTRAEGVQHAVRLGLLG